MSGVQPDEDGRMGPKRRELLLTGGALAATAVAGCSGITKREFSADPVYLEPGAQDELGLTEIGRNTWAIIRKMSSVDAEVTITNQYAAYKKADWAGGRDRPTLIEAFASRVNGTEGAGSAVVAYGSDSDLGTVTFPGLPGEPTVDGSTVSVVVPAGARADGEVTPEESVVLIPGGSVVSDLEGWFVVDAEECFPRAGWLPADGPWRAGDRWLHDDAPFAIDVDTRVLLPPGDDGPGSAFGLPPLDVPEERVDAGGLDPDGGSVVVAAPGDVVSGGGALFDKASPMLSPDVAPAPMGGATFGAAVLSTPAAEVAGQSVNPLATMSFEEILTDERTRGVFGKIVWDAGAGRRDLTWTAGPSEVMIATGDRTYVLGNETELKSFVGVVDAEDGPWGVGVHVARVEHEGDSVISASSHRRIIGTDDDFEDPKQFWSEGSFENARALTAATNSRFTSA